MKPKESDWKKFKNSLEKWRENYIKRKNEEIRAILEDNKRNETEKFWDIVEFQKKESKILRDCLDGYSRSKMSLQMTLMKRYEMIYPEDIEEFSDELKIFLRNIENFYFEHACPRDGAKYAPPMTHSVRSKRKILAVMTF